jgi:hypothetical protein
MKKSRLLKLYRSYIFGEHVKGIKDWETYMPAFAFKIPEAERQIIHDEYSNRLPTLAEHTDVGSKRQTKTYLSR